MSTLNEMHLVYPIPLVGVPLPAAVKVDKFLPEAHCRQLIAKARQKGFEPITRSRHGQESFTAEGCWLLPQDDELIFQRFAEKAAEINSMHWRLALSGIYSPFSVLRYRSGGWIRPHTDADYRIADGTKLSCVVQLVPKESFTGGELTIGETETYDLELGDAVFFPAQTIHAVSSIESGERYVLAAWAQGAPFV